MFSVDTAAAAAPLVGAAGSACGAESTGAPDPAPSPVGAGSVQYPVRVARLRVPAGHPVSGLALLCDPGCAAVAPHTGRCLGLVQHG